MKPRGFKDIYGYEGLYAVNENGDIYCYEKYRPKNGIVKERIMKVHVDPNTGYKKACLRKNNKKHWGSVHRIVAMAFVKNENNLPCVNHKDCDKLNNNYNNLEWCSYSHNIKHSYDNNKNYVSDRLKQLTSERGRVLNWADALKIRELHKLGSSMKSLSDIYSVSTSTIAGIVTYRTYKVEKYL